MSKIMNVKHSTLRWDRKLETRGLFRRRICFRSFLSYQNPWIAIWGNIFVFGGHFSKWIFAEGRSTRSPWCLGKIQGRIWRCKDNLMMKGLSKNVKIHEILLFHNSVRQKIGDPGSISTQNMFPLIPVVPKPPQLPYGAKYYFVASFSVFQFFLL